ncbi:MAG: hypothetical protein ACYTGZ_17020 [Planctomycetota bacterium]
MLRAGPLSDQRVIGLVNRRFIPFFFDLSNRGFAGDPKAREFVVKAKPVLGGRSVPTPPVLFMTPDGKVVGEVSNYASTEAVLKTLRTVMEKNPEYMQPAAEEKSLATPEARARLFIDLLDYTRARKELKGADSSHAHYLRGHLDRRAGRWTEMKENFAKVRDPLFQDDVRMELAYRHWVGGKFDELKKALNGFPKNSNRFTEARYYEGLALFHLGKKEDAQKIWASTIKACSQDPWIYRADWAYCNSKANGGRRMFSSGAGNRTSLLNRIGYMGSPNPDLKKRPDLEKR